MLGSLRVRAIAVLTAIVAAASFTAQGQGTLVSIRGGTAINGLPPSSSGQSVLGPAGITIAPGGQLRLNGTLDILSDKVTLTLTDVGSESHWRNQLRLANTSGPTLVDDDDHWRVIVDPAHSPFQSVGSVTQRAGVAQMEFRGIAPDVIPPVDGKTVINGQSPLKAIPSYHYAGIVLAYLNGDNQIVSEPTNRILVLHEDGGQDQDFDDYVGILVASAAPVSGGTVDLRIAGRPAADPIRALVSVTYPNGLPVSGLGAAAFVLRVNGASTPATFAFEPPPTPQNNRHTSVVLALDYGDTISAEARTAMETAAVTFLSLMRDDDFAAIVKSNASGTTKASVVRPFTQLDETGRQLLIEAVTNPYPSAGTNPYDAVALSVQQFVGASLPAGPKAVVFASDGGKSTSTADLNAVVSAANNAGISLFTVGVGEPGDRGEQILTLLANQTAGRYVRVATNPQIVDAYTDIFERLDSEYMLQLPPSAVTGCGPHRLQVQATIPGHTLSSTEAFTRCTPVFVPDLGRKTQTTAETALAAVGLTIGVITQRPSATVPVDEIVSQSPWPGTSVSGLTFVHLVLSTGPPAPITVPNVVGVALSPASSAILDASLFVGSITEQPSLTVIPGSVISQTPAAGTAAAAGSQVNLVVSSARSVPSVLNRSLQDAITLINGTPLAVGTVTVTTPPQNNPVQPGHVISQSPVSSTQVAVGYPVNLVIASGGSATVPTVTAQPQSAATTAITNAALVVGTVTPQSSATVAAGSVVSQTPPAGTQVAMLSPVNLVVSSGPPPVAVPSVAGLTQSAAASAITGASLVVGTVTQQSSSTVAAGSVISQNPAAGQSVAPGTAVNLAVSSGPAPVAVPSVTGLTQSAATSAITGASLVVGTVTQESSSTVAAGNVISQTPSAGTQVTVGSSVNIVVSSGAVVSPVPTVSLSASPTSIAAGESSTLTWSSANATACAASGGWDGSLATSGADTRSLSTTTVFTLTCTGPGGSAESAATVTVLAPTPPAVSLSANPPSVAAGQNSTLSWSSTDATACTASGGWSGSLATSGSETRALSAATAFTLACTGPGGTVAQTVEVSVTQQTETSDGGGGGAVDYLALALMLLCVGVNFRRRLRRIPR